MQQCVLKHFVAKLFEVDRDNNDLHGFYFLILVSAPSTMRLGLQQHSNKTTALAPAYLLHTGEHFESFCSCSSKSAVPNLFFTSLPLNSKEEISRTCL